MSPKRIPRVTLATLLFVSVSCMSVRTKAIITPADYVSYKPRIVGVVTASGEDYVFSASAPARLWGGNIVGTAAGVSGERVELAGPFRSVMKRSDGKIYQVTDSSGRVHAVREVVQEGPDKLVFTAVSSDSRQVSIPFSEVRLLRYKKTNPFLTVAAAGGGYLGLAILIVAVSGGIH
jgi:hypothetical protein